MIALSMRQDTLMLSVDNLQLDFINENKRVTVLEAISFDLKKNEVLGIVGESGSGKSVLSLAIMGLLPKNKTEIPKGAILFDKQSLLTLSEKELQSIRGNNISMIFQEPMSSLNPSMKCGEQVLEIIIRHKELTKQEAIDNVYSLFEAVKLPNVKRVFKAYPHELSGGQKQRVMIAMAIACEPKILIADEPTTALDVTVQQEIIILLKELQATTAMSIIFISHDLSLVSEIANTVVVLYNGKIVEKGNTRQIFNNPQKEYTKALLYARPSVTERLKKLPTIHDYLANTFKPTAISRIERIANHKKLYAKEPLLRVENISKSFYTKIGLFESKEFKAVQDVSFELYDGETLGLVGESGCGKSTLGNLILQLEKANSGAVFYKGIDITKIKGNKLRLLRKEIQLIFQDPFASLNPKMTIGDAIMEPMIAHKIFNTKNERIAETKRLLRSVGLQEVHFDRYPHEFSGVQRQRIGIARTIAVKPKLIICDESVSALDISVQAQVLNLLNDLKVYYGFSYLFISHDLSVVKFMSDQLLVMNKGIIEESGEADNIFANPEKKYTSRLVNAIPNLKK